MRTSQLPVLIPFIILVTAGWLPGQAVQAQEGAPPDAAELERELEALPEDERARVREQIRERREAMDPEQREAQREEALQRWREMTPEQRERMRERMQARRDRWEQLSPEEREARRQRMRDRRDGGP